MSVITATPFTAAPDTDPVTLVTGGIPAWTNGDWQELLALTTAPTVIAGFVLGNTNVGAQTQIEIELASGTVGHEVPLGGCFRLHISVAGNGGPSRFELLIPVGTIPSGTGIHGRVREKATTAHNVPIKLLLYESFDGDVVDFASGQAFHAVPTAEDAIVVGAADSLSIAPNAVAGADSDLLELTSGAGDDTSIAGLAFSAVAAQVDVEFDLLTGADGEETVISTLPASVMSVSGRMTYVYLPAVYPVAAGTRVSLVLRTSGTDTTPYKVALLYYGGGVAETPAFTDGEPGPLAMIAMTDRSGTVHPFSDAPLNDAASYEDGYKAPRVLSFNPITTALSDAQGRLKHVQFGATLNDTPRDLRGLLDDPTTKYLTSAPLTVKTIDDALRRQEAPWHLEMAGFVTQFNPTPDLRCEIIGSDWLKKKFARNRTVAEFWVPLLTRAAFPLLPDALINKAAPFWYGKVTDEIEGGASTPSDLYPRGTADPGWDAWGYDFWAFGSLPVKTYYVYGTTIKDGVESQIIAFELGITTTGIAPAFHLYVRTAVIPDLYRFYFCDDGAFNPFTNPLAGTLCRYMDVAPGDLVDNPYGAPNDLKYVLFDDESLGNDYHALVDDGAGGALLVPKGAVPTRYVGDLTIGGLTRSAFLVCRGAIKNITGVFVNGVAQTSTGSATELECPFLDDYATTFGANYLDLAGTRYTIVFATGQTALNAINGSAPITVNVYGIETIGDTSGTLIVSPVDAEKHFVRNFLAADYIAGESPQTTWLTTPPQLFTGAPMQDDDSYDQADADLAARLGGGYECAGGICADLEPESALDVLASLHLAGDFDSGMNRRGQYRVSVEPVAAPASDDVLVLTDVRHITDRSFRMELDQAQNFWNVWQFRHTKDYTGRTTDGWWMSGESRDPASITNNQLEQPAPSSDLRWLRNNTAQGIATILDVVKRRRTRFRNGLRPVYLEAPYLSCASAQLGTVLRLDHVEGPSASGWIGHDVRVIAIDTDCDRWVRRMVAYDLQPIYDGLEDSSDPTQVALGERPDTLISLQQNLTSALLDITAVQGAIATLDTEVADHETRISGLEASEVTGPGTATDKAIARFDGTTGTVLQNSAPIVQDDGRISSVTDPASAQDVATKAYVDGIAVNVGRRDRVRAATTANITIATALNSGDSLDGVSLATGDLVLVKDQTAQEENGVYVVGVSPARASEFDSYDEHPGSLIAVEEGSTNADTLWLCTSNAGGTLNTTAIVFSALGVSGGITQLTGDVIAGPGSGSQAATIANGAVSLAKQANLAEATVIGRAAGAGTGVPTALTAAQLRTVIGAKIVITWVLDGHGSVLTTGVKGGWVQVPAAFTITRVIVMSTDATPTSGSIVVDIWKKDPGVSYPPTVSDTITASAKPTLSSATRSVDSTLTGWTTSVAADDVLGIKVDSVTSLKKVTLILEGAL